MRESNKENVCERKRERLLGNRTAVKALLNFSLSMVFASTDPEINPLPLLT